MAETPTSRMAPKPNLNANAKRDNKPYLSGTLPNGHIVIYYDRLSRVPACKVPEKVSFWVAIHRIAEQVRILAAEGMTDAQIKVAGEADYRAFREAELSKKVRLGRLKISLRQSVTYERKGWNTWPDKLMDVEDHPELVAYAFDPTPKAKRQLT